MKDDTRHARVDRTAFFVVPLALGIVLSHAAGATFAELPRLEAISRLGPVVRSVAAHGPAALWSASAHAAYSTFDGHGTLPALIAAWSRLSIGRVGVLDPLTSARLPFILIASLAPLLVYAASRPSLGRRPALLAGALLLATPRWLHAVACGADAAVVASLWWLVLVPYLRSLRKPGVAPFAAVSLALGVGASISIATLWVLPLIVVHFWLARRGTSRRLAARGRLPVPATVAGAVVALPVFVLVTNPALWKDKVIALVRWTLVPLKASVVPTLFAGHVVRDAVVPFGYVPTWLALTLPAAVLVCALVGLVALAHRALARRFASGALCPPRDPQALGVLVALGLLATVFAPALEARPLVLLPPRLELTLPFVAIAAGVGLDRVARAAGGGKGWWAVAGGVVLATLFLALRAPRTASASFDLLLGGARGVVATRVLAAGDGSELAVLAPRIDALGRTHVTLSTRDVPKQLWPVLDEFGRLHTNVEAVPAGGELELARGARHDGRVVATVKRDGAVLWTLTRR